MPKTDVERRIPSFASRPRVPIVLRYQGRVLMRVLIVPGLRGSGPAHWQTWLQAHWRDAVRVQQRDWAEPDLARWSQRIAETLDGEPAGPWVAVAHSFGCLALAHHLAHRPGRGIEAALLVAPAEPDRFAAADRLPHHALGVPAAMIASDTDPWMHVDSAVRWARRWNARFTSLGDAGHINVDSGHGPLPEALEQTRALMKRAEALAAKSA
jgi:predicted alpha/beta hydrolase family esterase